jgi:hypothetical protein
MALSGLSTSRKLAGVVVLLALAVIGAVLLVPYGKNFQYQNALDDLVVSAVNADSLRAAAVDKAAALGLPLRASDVKVVPLASGGFKVEAVYLVRVDVGFYAVDLHFHPAAEK